MSATPKQLAARLVFLSNGDNVQALQRFRDENALEIARALLDTSREAGHGVQRLTWGEDRQLQTAHQEIVKSFEWMVARINANEATTDEFDMIHRLRHSLRDLYAMLDARKAAIEYVEVADGSR